MTEPVHIFNLTVTRDDTFLRITMSKRLLQLFLDLLLTAKDHTQSRKLFDLAAQLETHLHDVTEKDTTDGIPY